VVLTAQPGLLDNGCGSVAAVVRLGVVVAESRVGARAGLAGSPPVVLGLGLGFGLWLGDADGLGLGNPVGLGLGLGLVHGGPMMMACFP